MMNKKCEVCSHTYEAKRSDSKYCSNACKQISYTSKKKENVVSEILTDVFYLDEYVKVCEHFEIHSSNFPFMFFCFLRRKLNRDASIESVIKFMDIMWDGDNIDDCMRSKAYALFKDNFLSKTGGVFGVKQTI